MMISSAEIRAGWLAQLKSTEPADRERAEAGVRRLYSAAGFPEPDFLLWYASPCAASWPVALLAAEGNRALQHLLAPSALSKTDAEQAEQTRADLARKVGIAEWRDAVRAIGRPRVGTLLMMPDPSVLFSSALLDARFSLVDDVSVLFAIPDETDDLARAENYLRGGNHGVLTSAIHCSSTASVIGNSFFSEYSLVNLADDERRAAESQKDLPSIIDAASNIGRSLSFFWPFEHAAFLCDRPSELHVNDRQLLHRADGPAAVYRDGWSVFAWNGKAVPGRWIMETESVPPREYKGFDATFKAFAESRAKHVQKTTRRPKAGSILGSPLPADPVARLEQLRAHNGGSLPVYDRYAAGEHLQAWKELVSLGDAVRDDPHAADALAVAYETMRRVEHNVRTIVQRLVDMEYQFTPDGQPGGLGAVFGGLGKLFGGSRRPQNAARAHVAPPPGAGMKVAAFEKEFATLPLSLRVFYEVVGEVNFMGTHAAIDPPNNPIAPDPLLVYGLDEGIVEFDGDDDDEERPTAITIAPDDLHKANTSGGDAYEMVIPDLRADGELLNERHHLFFVDYLRLAFEYGGFPGYEGQSRVPPELKALSAGLLPF